MPGLSDPHAATNNDLRALITVVRLLVDRMDGVLCHLSSVDADYGRVKNTLGNHETRLDRLEREHNFDPGESIGESSALFPAVSSP
jgi:hypothetical protein